MEVEDLIAGFPGTLLHPQLYAVGVVVSSGNLQTALFTKATP